MIQSVKISIVMPAYNAAEYITPTIRSVLGQTHKNWELIVVDDCSTDATAELVESFASQDARVRLIRLDRNHGAPAGPRNIGVREAVGEWVAFLDADDVWHPQKLECQLRVLELTGSKFCSTQMVDFSDLDALTFRPITSYTVEEISLLKQLIKFRTPTSSVLAHRDLIHRHPFNEDPRFKAREDLDCWLRCHEELGRSVKINSPLLGYRIVAGQISGKKWEMLLRHYHVLRRYRFRSGRGLGIGALLFTATHFLFAFYYRVWKKAL